MSQVRDASGNSGQATAIQAIHAPPKVVWRQLLDFNAYPKKVDKLAEVSAPSNPTIPAWPLLSSQPSSVPSNRKQPTASFCPWLFPCGGCLH